MGRLGMRFVWIALGFLTFRPSAANALAGAPPALIICIQPESGERFQVLGGIETASYQFNERLVSRLKALNVGGIEPSGIGRFIPYAGWVYRSNYKNGFWFTIHRENDQLVFNAYSNSIGSRTGKPTATLKFHPRHCQN